MTGMPCSKAWSLRVFIQGIKTNDAAIEQTSIPNKMRRTSLYWRRPRVTKRLARTISAIPIIVLMYASTLKMLPATMPATWRSVRVLKMVGATTYPTARRLPTQILATKMKRRCAPACIGELTQKMVLRYSELPRSQLRDYHQVPERQQHLPLPC